MLGNPNPEVFISEDIKRLEQAMINLLANGIKYPPSADAFSIRTKKLTQVLRFKLPVLIPAFQKPIMKKFLPIFPSQSAIICAVGFGDVPPYISRNN